MEKKENYDDEMAFIDITNAHHEEVLNDPNAFIKVINERQQKEKEVLEREEETRKDIARTVQIVQKSITSKKVAAEEAKKIKDEKIKKRKKIVIIAILASALTIGTIATFGPKASNYLKDEWDYQKGRNILNSNAYLMIQSSSLGGFDYNHQDFIIFDNSPEKYERLGIKEDHSVYVFGEIIGQKDKNHFEENEEFIDFLHSLTYTDAEGNSRHYKDFEDFLQVNGYKDKNEWIAASRDTIIERYRRGEIKPAQNITSITYGSDVNPQVSKKGR